MNKVILVKIEVPKSGFLRHKYGSLLVINLRVMPGILKESYSVRIIRPSK